ncbi:MAG TPA: nicotinate phosphoribosyltransferase [Actinomycetota bacterium]|nr:nicotinate phosphoribosyltransferase [Actinomycetota bacterium]
MGGALLTDLYELNMARSYLRRGMVGPATFSLFVRHLPENRGFLVAAGLEDCLSFLEGFSFEEADLRYLREVLGYDEETVETFRGLRFTGDVWAVPEGRIVFAGEPLLEVTGPIAECQLVETYLLNQVTFQTTLATKGARCRLAARGRDLVDFAFRRTQGVEAGLQVARTSALVGFVATSNVEAARRFGLRAAGTMAHSFIEAFPSEAEAFRAFARDFPDRATFLVDTYDTLAGVHTAVRVVRELGLADRLGIRLDSGDLLALSREARRILDRAGLAHVRIFASGGLDEYAIDELVRAGAPIDAFGVGTRMGVSADVPYLDTVYKLVQFGDRPVMKLSPEKATAPGPKQVFRRPGFAGDVVGLRDELPLEGTEPLLVRVMAGGRRVAPPDTLEAARARFEADLAQLPEEARDLHRPRAPRVELSDRLRALRDRVAAELRGALEEAGS